MSDSTDSTFDVAIVGGGMVGASLAVALEGQGLKIALIEAVPPEAATQPSFDERTTALSNGSRRILETLGLWPQVASAATPIERIHVSDRGHFGFARIAAAEQGLPALGYVLPNRVLGRALHATFAARRDLRVLCPARVAAVRLEPEAVQLAVAGTDGMERCIGARLVVAADGAGSVVRSAFGVVADVHDYGQTAVVTTVTPRRFHEHVAYERFTEDGPLALLPAAQGHCVLVMTLTPARAEHALGWSDAEFLAEVQRRFGFRLGRFLKVGRRAAYPLSLTQARRTTAARCAIIGNAAQGLHPVAGMGFNLGLRDVATLAELIAGAGADGRHADASGAGERDCGDPALLAAYDAWRAADRRLIIGFTDGLVRLFASGFAPLHALRNLGLLAFDLSPPAKAALSALSTGSAGRVPRLARGVPLQRGASGVREADR